jgi:hypothetical protein
MNRAKTSLLRLIALVALISPGACVTVKPPSFLEEPPVRDWKQTLKNAQLLAVEGQTAGADSLLAQFASTYPNAPQAAEATYWRALVDLNASPASPRLAAAVPLLQSYVAAGPTTPHFTEATALLQTAARLDTLSRTYLSKGEVTAESRTESKAPSPDTKSADTKGSDAKAQDDEIRRLKDELAKSKDELERIKKRLAEPTKKPPRS